MNKKKIIYLSLLILTVLLVTSIYVSYGFFTNKLEEHGKLNIVVGTLDYKIESNELKNNQMIVNPNSIIELEIEIDSLNPISSKYELYYLLDKEVNDFEIGYFEVTEDLPKGEISTNGRKKIKVGIKNQSSEKVTVTFGVEGGFTNQNLILNTGKSLSLLNYCRIGETSSFAYTGTSQSFTTQCSGIYQVELWGAQGGSYCYEQKYNTGSYVSGNIYLKDNLSFFVFVGESTNIQGQPAFNGGGIGYASLYGDYGQTGAFSGGGATDIRLVDGNWDDFGSLKSRIMVAAGGGGDASHTSPSNTMYSCNVNNSKVLGKYGGTLNGIDNVDFGILGGKQDNGGICNFMEYCGIGSFGKGGDAIKNSHANGGGGGGYYGGAADRSEYLQGTSGIIGGASGSCFISGYPGCNAISEDSTENNIIHTNQSKHYSGYVFNNSQMIAGNEEMPTHDGLSTMIGNGGNGYAKITYLGN